MAPSVPTGSAVWVAMSQSLKALYVKSWCSLIFCLWFRTQAAISCVMWPFSGVSGVPGVRSQDTAPCGVCCSHWQCRQRVLRTGAPWSSWSCPGTQVSPQPPGSHSAWDSLVWTDRTWVLGLHRRGLNPARPPQTMGSSGH